MYLIFNSWNQCIVVDWLFYWTMLTYCQNVQCWQTQVKNLETSWFLWCFLNVVIAYQNCGISFTAFEKMYHIDVFTYSKLILVVLEFSKGAYYLEWFQLKFLWHIFCVSEPDISYVSRKRICLIVTYFRKVHHE